VAGLHHGYLAELATADIKRITQVTKEFQDGLATHGPAAGMSNAQIKRIGSVALADGKILQDGPGEAVDPSPRTAVGAVRVRRVPLPG
jgi:hypothetical protein